MLKVIKINNFGEIDVKDSLVKLSVMFTGAWCINKIYDLSKLFLPKCSKIIRYTPMFKKQINSVYEQMEQTIFESWSYKNDWDGTDKNGKPLPSGPYLYIIDRGDETQVEEGWLYIFN